MKNMKRVICLGLSATLAATICTTPLAQAVAPVLVESTREECNGETAPTVDSVTELIAQIGDVTLKSGDKINKAAVAYTQLDEESRTLVPNAAALTEAQQVFELEQALEPLYIKRDDVEQKTWIVPQKALLKVERTTVLPYFLYMDQGGLSPLQIAVEYYMDRWVFFNEIVISTDGQTYTKSFSNGEVLRDNARGIVWEWVNYEASEEEIGLLQKMAGAKKTVVRYKGKDRFFDWVMINKDKKAILDTLNAYNLMKNASDTVRAKALAGVQ